MCKKEFKKRVSPEDPRLKNPQIAVFVIPTEFGPIVPIIKRRKILSDKYVRGREHEYLQDSKGRYYEEWCDLPGGKADPIFDPVSYKIEKEKCDFRRAKDKKYKGKPEDTAKITGIEPAYMASMRETDEETGLYVVADKEKFAEASHPIKPDLKREFHAAVFCGGTLKNMVPGEHDYVFPTDPENAIELLGDRVPQEVRDFIRQEAARIMENLQGRNIINMAMYRDRKYLETLRSQGFPSVIAA